MTDDKVELTRLWRMVVRDRWLVASITLLFGVVGVAYAMTAERWYRAEVLLIPTNNEAASGLMSQFGGLASLAGIRLGGGEDAEPLAVLKSSGFAKSFIEDEDLLRVLLSKKWDTKTEQWKGPQERWPDVRDAVRYFDRKVRRVVQDRKTGLVTLAVEWRDPELTARWANLMAERLNARMRERTIAEATANVAYLKGEIAGNDLLALQQPMGRLMEMELQKLLLARSNSQYAFRIVDAAQVPKRPIRPQRVPVVITALLLGVLASVMVVLARASSSELRTSAALE